MKHWDVKKKPGKIRIVSNKQKFMNLMGMVLFIISGVMENTPHIKECVNT